MRPDGIWGRFARMFSGKNVLNVSKQLLDRRPGPLPNFAETP